ncbi:MAG TPA: AAA family ATPase [Thermoanaerobaculia bacterium]
MNRLVLPRTLEASLSTALVTFPIVVITGARQAGKSTLVRQVDEGTRPYLTLDDLDVLERSRAISFRPVPRAR